MTYSVAPGGWRITKPRSRPPLSRTVDRRTPVLLTVALSLVVAVTVTAQPPTTVVVVRFENLSAQTADDWIGAGIVETVAADLQNAGLTIVGSHVSGATPTPGVDWRVEGGFQRVGDLLRVTARVVDVKTGVVAHRTRLDGMFDQLFDLQDDVAAHLAEWFVVTPAAQPTPASAVPSAVTAGGFRPPTLAGAPPPTTPAATVGSVNQAVPETPSDVTGFLTLGEASSSEGPAQRATATTRQPRGGGGFAAAPVPGRPVAMVTRTDTPPQIDGVLDDSVWETATHITDFIQIAPDEGAPASEDTETWVTFDSEHLYFAFYAHYADPGMMRVNRADREEIRGDDRMSVLFDPFLDQQRAYQFEVNGYGVQADSLVNADGSRGFSRSSASSSVQRGSSGSSRGGGGSGLSNSGQFGIRGDDSWDALFDTSGRLVEDGWVAEMRIPFKSLRYPSRGNGEGHRWGFQITRVIRGKSEAQSWSPISRAVAGQLTQFGELEGLSDLSTSRNLEFLPEVTGFRFGALDTATGVFDEGSPEGEAGLGIKYGITPNLTADVTFNPDFSQIELDRPQIATNQRFALFFPEQRPFFLEGQEIFQTATPLTLVHTRTVINPRVGAKLTGKVGQTTLGVMVADDEAAGRFDDPTDVRFGSTAQTIVGRARYDLYPESYVGAIMTAREFGDDYNRVAGVDARFRLGQTHRVSVLAVGSETRDQELGSLSGPAFEADFASQGRNLSYSAAYSSIDPEFQTNTGFLPRVDLRQTSGTVGYRWWPESALLTWGPSVTYLRLYDHTGVLQDEQLQGSASFSFRNNISLTGVVNRDLERFQEVDFRKTGYGFVGVISARTVSLFGGFNWGDGILYDELSPFLGQSTSGNFNFRLQPTSRLRTELRTVFSNFVDPADSSEVFDVKIFRTRTTYQFTDRLLLRHILEHNTRAVTLGNNVLFTYRINAGTVVFLGYDDRYQRASLIEDLFVPTDDLQRTNRAVFGKLAYLLRF